ncbi:MAG: T9SS type A sorting domain-containing protein [Dysgonamonadaceae bacterium]|jgi:O-glycosyl hydrolase|nr:T9SS type A sorting domain-containing protein [Dysgonamonadaceae bacterium]
MIKAIKLLICAAAVFQSAVAQIIINPAVTYQTIEGFAASDCWTVNYVGKYWTGEAREKAAQLLFSREMKSDGSPEGIGLSMWRVNLGAGTAEQGDNSGIEDISRRAECFLDASGAYDWTKQAGQQWFMQKAKEYGCESFVLFSNSPPVALTRNGRGFSPGDGNSNLKTDKYPNFADFLTTAAARFAGEGYNIRYISPLNEPQWDWKDGSQEGSPWQNSEIKKIVQELDKSIISKQLNAKILITEAGQFDRLYQSNGRASNQIYELLDAGSANYLGEIPSLAPVIGGHSYWTHDTDAQLRSVRENVRNRAADYGLGVFSTEWSMLSSNQGFPAFEDASYMDNALLMAKIIHGDMVFANAASWSFWTAMDMERWGHKNRFLLISLNPDNPYRAITEAGNLADRPTLWVLGNYSLFVRPGYKRIELTGADNLQGLMGSAYISPDGKTVAAVFVNLTSETKRVSIDFQNLADGLPLRNRMFVTSSLYSLKRMANVPETFSSDYQMPVPARSVATIIYEFDDKNAIETSGNQDFQVCPNPASAGGKLRFLLPENINSNLLVSIFDSAGNFVCNKKLCIFADAGEIPVPACFEKGVYFVVIDSGKKKYCKKLIIK